MPAAELVVGDVVKLSLGAIVAADVSLIEGSIPIDQSMLTGESFPVEAVSGTEAYAGALVSRGEAIAEVIATGIRTKFGRMGELVRAALAERSQQKTVLNVVRNLVLFNGAATILMAIYAFWLAMPLSEIAPLILVAVLSSIPVALPSMFTLAAAVGACALSRRGVLPTSLSAVDVAAGIDILCADKTGTLTRNELAVMSVCPMPTFEKARVLARAALASSGGGQDPVDTAVRNAASAMPSYEQLELVTFVPFDPAVKSSEAIVRQPDGATIRVIKGTFSVVAGMCQPSVDASSRVDELQPKSFRVLAVAAGPQTLSYCLA